jgi:ferrous iron transport protein A
MFEDDHHIAMSEMTVGEDGVVLDFQAGCIFQNRLVSLGFTPGAHVNMTQNYGHGPLIVTVRGTRVALGRSEAAKIIVGRGKNE